MPKQTFVSCEEDKSNCRKAKDSNHLKRTFRLQTTNSQRHYHNHKQFNFHRTTYGNFQRQHFQEHCLLKLNSLNQLSSLGRHQALKTRRSEKRPKLKANINVGAKQLSCNRFCFQFKSSRSQRNDSFEVEGISACLLGSTLCFSIASANPEAGQVQLTVRFKIACITTKFIIERNSAWHMAQLAPNIQQKLYKFTILNNAVCFGHSLFSSLFSSPFFALSLSAQI